MSKLCEKITKETSFMFRKMMVLARRVNEVRKPTPFFVLCFHQFTSSFRLMFTILKPIKGFKLTRKLTSTL